MTGTSPRQREDATNAADSFGESEFGARAIRETTDD